MKTIYFDVNVPKILATKLFSGIFPFVYYSPISPVRYGDIPERELPGPGWVRVKNVLTGICGADISMFFVKASPRISIAALPGMPRAYMGHEVIGRVIEIGGGVKDLKIGDRVTLQRYLPCCSIKEIDPPCVHCKEGNYTLCENFSEGTMPENLGAGFGEQFIAHRSQLVKVPKSIPDEIAVLIEPASVALHAVLKRPPEVGEKILVIGAGTIGLNVIQFARVMNPRCTIFLLEKIDFKKDLAVKLGADHVLEGDFYDAVSRATGGKLYRAPLGNSTMLGGFDVIYDCVGYSVTINDSLRWLRAKGTYVMIGNQLEPVSFDQTPIWQQEINVIGVNAHGCESYKKKRMSSFELAMEMIQRGKINLKGFVTHRFPLKDYKKAFQLVREKSEDVIKAVFVVD
jgi:threonine dehydrogenase-like Zn-dependent dehydrogenase